MTFTRRRALTASLDDIPLVARSASASASASGDRAAADAPAAITGEDGIPLLNTMTTTPPVAPAATDAPAPISEEDVVAPEPTTPTSTQGSPAPTDTTMGTTMAPATPTLPNGLDRIPGLAELAASKAVASDAAQSPAATSVGESNSGALVVAIGVVGGVVAALLVITCVILRCNRREKEAKDKAVV